MAAVGHPILPPSGKLTIPEVVKFNLKNNPSRPFFIFTDPSIPSDTHVITHLEFGRAAHRIARMLQTNFYSSRGEVISIVALSDSILYQALVAGCIVAGLVPFPMSPRNSSAAIISLLEKTSCHRLITTSTTLKPLIASLREQLADKPEFNDFQIVEVPSLATAYPNLGHEQVDHPFEQYSGSLQPISEDDICIYIHSSGSTGLPKPIAQTHKAWMQWSAMPGVTDFIEYRDLRQDCVLGCTGQPPFHTLGLNMQLLVPLYGVIPIAVDPPTATEPHLLPVTPAPQNILDLTKLNQATAVIAVPSVVRVWSMSYDAIEYLKRLDFVVYAGGPLPLDAGNYMVEAGVRLRCFYGATEFGLAVHVILPYIDNRDWNYVRFMEDVNVRWTPQGDGTFEAQILSGKKNRPVILNLPDVDGYASSDIFARHPTEEGLWRVVGRLDDVIIHSSGEKTVPGPMESILLGSPFIQGAIVFGRAREATGVLVEPFPQYAIDVNDHAQIATLRYYLWPIIEEANKISPAFSRIYKDMILITSDTKPLPRTGKGTVMRKAALQLYEEEIDKLYQPPDLSAQVVDHVAAVSYWDFHSVKAWLLQQASELISSQVSPEHDLFEQGFDSLSATFLRSHIIRELQTSDKQIIQLVAKDLSQNVVYAYPIINDLAAHLVSLQKSPGTSHDLVTSHVSAMEDMIRKYSVGLREMPSIDENSTLQGPATVILTGSSGNLGSEILAALVQNPRVERIYALNRPSGNKLSIQERHRRRFEEKGLDPKLISSEKISYIAGNAAQPYLGMGQEQYNELCKTVNVVIHNAWRLDFNLSLSAFEPLINQTRCLIDLLKSGPHAINARFLFMSSVSVAQSWPLFSGPYPEESIGDPSFAVGKGYGESKFLPEADFKRPLSGSVRFLEVNRMVLGRRQIGYQFSSSPASRLGVLPNLEGIVSWIPMDVAAAAIVDAALAVNPSPPSLNLVHPQPIAWKELLIFFQASISEALGRNLEIVPLAEWMALVERKAKAATKKDLSNIPAIKLLDFFRSLSRGNDEIVSSNALDHEAGGLGTFSMDKMLAASPVVMNNIHLMGGDDILRWVRYWKSVGYLY